MMSAHGEQQRSSTSHRGTERLLRAIAELRELEREKRRMPVSSAPFTDIARRVEAKAREVFRIAQESADDAEDTGRH